MEEHIKEMERTFENFKFYATLAQNSGKNSVDMAAKSRTYSMELAALCREWRKISAMVKA